MSNNLFKYIFKYLNIYENTNIRKIKIILKI